MGDYNSAFTFVSRELMADNDTVPTVGPPIDIVLNDAQQDTVSPYSTSVRDYCNKVQAVCLFVADLSFAAAVVFRMITSGLSLLGCIVAIFSMVYFGKLKALSARLIFLLTLSAFGEAIFNLLTIVVYENESDLSGLCIIQGIGLQITQVAEFLWTVIICFNLYMVVVKHRSNMAAFEKFYHIVVWVTTAVLTILPLFTLSYGPAGVWCWIQKTGTGDVWRFVTFYVPAYICIFVMLILYGFIINTVRNTMKDQADITDQDQKRAQNAMDRLRAYPLIFMLLYIFPTINRIANWITNDEYFFLYVAHVLTAPLLGFVNAIVYGLDEDIRKRYRMLFIRKGWCTSCIDPIPAEELAEEQSGGGDEDGETFVNDQELGIQTDKNPVAQSTINETIY